MAKTVNHSTPRDRERCCVSEIYKDLYTAKQHPVTPAFFERLAIEFTNWAKDNEKAITIQQFPLDKGIPWKTWTRWVKKRPELRAVYDDVKHIIASKRERLMLFGNIKEKSNMYMMHRYSEEWDNSDKRWSALKEKEDNRDKPTNITVVMDDFTKPKKDVAKRTADCEQSEQDKEKIG